MVMIININLINLINIVIIDFLDFLGIAIIDDPDQQRMVDLKNGNKKINIVEVDLIMQIKKDIIVIMGINHLIKKINLVYQKIGKKIKNIIITNHILNIQKINQIIMHVLNAEKKVI